MNIELAGLPQPLGFVQPSLDGRGHGHKRLPLLPHECRRLLELTSPAELSLALLDLLEIKRRVAIFQTVAELRRLTDSRQTLK